MNSSAELPEVPQGAIPANASFIIRHAKSLAAIAALIVFAAVGFAIYHLTEEVTYADVVRGLEATGSGSIALAILFTALSFASLCLYDINALAFIGLLQTFPSA